MTRHRVGHVVWYRVESWEGGPLTDYAAIITRVAAGASVDLMVFDPNTDPYARRNVPNDESGATASTWRWPVDEPGLPYR